MFATTSWREVLKRGELSKEVYDRIKPVGSQRSRMYGLPMIHKENIPLRPILSMVRLAQHELAKWLGEVLQPVLDSLSRFLVKDSFTFAESIGAKTPTSEDNIMSSFDIKSLFTNVPLTETIEICAHLLHHTDLEQPMISEHVFVELMNTATREVEFIFNNMMYVQTDGVAMGSPLGPALANIFVGYHEMQKLVSKGSIPPSYTIGMLMTFLLCLSLGRHVTISRHGSTLSMQR